MTSTKKVVALGFLLSTAVAGFFWWKRKEVERAGEIAADPWVFATSGNQSNMNRASDVQQDVQGEPTEPKKAAAKTATAKKTASKKATAKKAASKKATAKKAGDSS
jgi:hypothetical protein